MITNSRIIGPATLAFLAAQMGYADSFTYSGSSSINHAGAAASADQGTFKAMNGDPKMQGVAGFFQANMHVHSVIRMLRAILGEATANSSVQNWDQKTDATYNFTVTDAEGNNLGMNVVLSAKTANVPADLQAEFPLSMAISVGATAAAAQAATPVIYAYFAKGATGNKSNGAMLINGFNPGIITAGTKNTGAAPGIMPMFSGTYVWKVPNDGVNDNQAIGLFSVQPPTAAAGQPGMPTQGMTVFFKEAVNATTHAAKIGFTMNLPAAGPAPAVVMSMTGSGTLGICSTTNLPGPTGQWTIGVQPVPVAQQGATQVPPPPNIATVVNFATACSTPTFVSSSGTPVTVNQGQISVSQISNSQQSGNGNTCGTGGNQQCSTFAAPSSSGQAPGLASNMVPPKPGSGGTQPTSTVSAVFGSTVTVNPPASGNLCTF